MLAADLRERRGDLPVYRPRMKPYAKQLEALRRGWAADGFAFLMDMGTGKSKVTIDNACVLYEAPGDEPLEGLVVVAPKSVCGNWTRRDDARPGELQAHVWEGVPYVQYLWSSSKSRVNQLARDALTDMTSPALKVLVVNVEALSTSDEAFDFVDAFLRRFRCLMAVDESSKIKNPKSMRTKALLALGPRARWRRILTGTPSGGSPTDLFTQFQFLSPGCLGHRSWFTFRAEYAVLRDMYLGGRVVKKEVGAQNLDRLAARMSLRAIQVRRDEVVDLPPKVQLPPREVEMTAEQKRIYAELRDRAEAEWRLGGERITTQLVITQLQRMHQVLCGHVRTDDGEVRRIETNRPKALLEMLEEAPGEQAIVWCSYVSDLAVVAEELRRFAGGPERVAEWHGAIPQAARERGEASFQAGEARYMVANQDSGGYGRTWTAATLVIYYSNNHSLELRKQSEDRAHRIGQTRAVAYGDLICPGTVEEKIVAALRRKQEVVDLILRDPRAWL